MESDRPIRLAAVPDSPRFLSAEEFPAVAKAHWMNAKTAYDGAFSAMSNLHSLLHKPGEVRVLGRVTGALAEAKRLRDEADRLVIEFSAIKEAAEAVARGD